MQLTDDELQVLVGLVNDALGQANNRTHRFVTIHDRQFRCESNDGVTVCDPLPLLRKLLDEAVSRGVTQRPACFRRGN